MVFVGPFVRQEGLFLGQIHVFVTMMQISGQLRRTNHKITLKTECRKNGPIICKDLHLSSPLGHFTLSSSSSSSSSGSGTSDKEVRGSREDRLVPKWNLNF